MIDKYRNRLEQQKHHLVAQSLHVQRARDMVQIAALGAQAADKQVQIAALGAQVSEKQVQIAALGAQVSDKQAELEKITKSLGWRLLSRYGPIKYRYLLPIYRLLGAAPTETDESEANKPPQRT